MSEVNATAPAEASAPESLVTVTQVPVAPVPEGINIAEAIAILNGGNIASSGEDDGLSAVTPEAALPKGEQPDDTDDGLVVEVPGEAAAAAVAAPVVDVKAQITEIATQYGIDPAILTQFPDVDSAYTAISLFADQYANAGIDEGGPTTVAQQPAAPAPVVAPVVDDLEFQLDESALDDQSLAAFKALKTALANERKERGSLRADVDAILQERASAHKRDLHARAAAVVDSFGSEKYGTSANRTAAQRLAVNTLYALADNIQIGLGKRGLTIPPIEQIVRQAALADGVRPASKTAAAAATAPAVPPVVAAAAPKKAPAPPRPLAPGTIALGKDSHLGNLHKDPAFMGAAARILSRPSG